MKKLLTIAAFLIAGVMANAASFKWTGANIYSSDGTTKFTGNIAIYAYLDTATVATSVKVTDAYVVSGTIKSDAAGTVTGFTYAWADAVANGNYNFYFVIEDGDKVFNSSVSDPAKIVTGKAAATATTTVAFANMASATQTKSNWVSSSVPEPTSGLMMLLGMAGLALRRKRA